MFRKVFISYAKEDIKFAAELYAFLHQSQFDPWLDKKKLLAGSNWDLAIRKALKEADFIILLLSSRSVSKRGYVQREYKLALQNWETRLATDIYIIPVLIDECEVPDSLGQFQWVRFDDDNVFKAILEALDAQRTTYLKSAFVEELLDAHYTKTLNLDLPSWLKIESNVEIPQFPQNPYFNADYVNAFIQHDIMDHMSEYSSFITEEDTYTVLPNHLKEHLYFSSYYEMHFVSKEYLSLTLYMSFYHGGPHPNHSIQTRNFSFSPVKKLRLSDVVRFSSIKDFIKESYDKYATEDTLVEGGYLVERINEEFEKWGGQDIDFVFNEKSLILVPFNILPHVAQGSGNIEIPLSHLELKINP